MKVVDDKKIAEWMERNGRMRQSVETRGLEKSVRTDTFLLALMAGTFDPTPVQPDTEIDPDNLPTSITIKGRMTRSEFEQIYGPSKEVITDEQR